MAENSTAAEAPFALADPVSDVLDSIRMRSAVFFLWEPRWPFGTAVADGEAIARQMFPHSDNVVSYHIVTEGNCWGCVAGEAPVQLYPGDVLVLPRGDRYMIASEPRFPDGDDLAASVEFFRMLRAGEIPPVISDGGPGPAYSQLICGFLSCDLRPFNPLLSTLPKILRVARRDDEDDPLSPLIRFALSETRQARGGERCLLGRLSETLFIEVVRRYLRDETARDTSWINGLRDPLVGRVLTLLHARHGERWTLEKLAAEAGASRTTLTGRFSELLGETPMNYLTRWRMQLAANRLRETNDKLIGIAVGAGYDSEAAFGRAFKRVVGVSPSAWRRGVR